MKMLQKQCKFSGISFSTLLACMFFLPIIIIIIAIGPTTTTTASSLPRPRGIAAISLTSLSQTDFVAAAAATAVDAEEQQQEEKNAAQPKIINSEGVKCKTEQGTDVDWFIAYKLPKIRTSSNSLVRAGLAYAYILPPVTRDTFPSPTTAATTGLNANTETRNSVNVSNKENASGHKAFSAFCGERDNLNNNRTTDAKSNEDGNLVTATASILPGSSVFSRKTTSRPSKSSTAVWTLSNIGIDSPASMVGKTVAKLYEKGNQDVAFLTYNDQPPVGPTVESGGHSKGIIVTSLASGGIWIQHSVPHFPLIDPNNYHYQYPGTGKSNGQVFHCISFSSTKDVDDLAKIFEITRPHVVNYSFPTDSFKTAFPQLLSIANRTKHETPNSENNQFVGNPPAINQSQSTGTSATLLTDGGGGDREDKTKEVSQLPCLNEINERACPNGTVSGHKRAFIKKNQEAVGAAVLIEKKKSWDLLEIRSAGGKKLRAYVKGPSFGEDIYSSWIAPTNKVKLSVQSWLNGPHPFESNCTVAQYSVYNILDKRIAEQAFSTHNDHSKWALSLSTEQPLVCISDLNRMEHQLKRGGVTVCFTDVAVWTTFSSSIIDVQPCPRLPSAASTIISIDDDNGRKGGELDIPFTSLSSSPSSLSAKTISIENSSFVQVDKKYDEISGSTSTTMANTVTLVDEVDYHQESTRSATRKSRRQNKRIHDEKERLKVGRIHLRSFKTIVRRPRGS